MGKKPSKKDDRWLEAKRRCRLSDEDVRMAKELGLNPRSLIKNVPAKSQPWKAPVGEWIRDMHAKRFGRTRGANAADSSGRSPSSPMNSVAPQTPVPNSHPNGRITIESTPGEGTTVRVWLPCSLPDRA